MKCDVSHVDGAREQLQTQHSEFLSTRRELGAVRRECERLSKELEEVMKVQRSKDQDTARLSEELGASQARTAQAEARLLAETNRLQREKQELQACHREEVGDIALSENVRRPFLLVKRSVGLFV